MNDANTDVIQGTLDMLILKTLSLEPMHGVSIADRVEQISGGVFKVNPGSLLTALQRLERRGWLDSGWRQTENSRRAKFYALTRAGRKQLEFETADWPRRVNAIARIVNDANTDVIQGTLDMLILKTLSLEPMDGFGIPHRVEQISGGVFKVNPGSLLTALQRLERGGWLESGWRQTENSRRAKFYALTRAGQKQLEFETADWTQRAAAIARIMKAEG